MVVVAAAEQATEKRVGVEPEKKLEPSDPNPPIEKPNHPLGEASVRAEATVLRFWNVCPRDSPAGVV